MILQLEKINHQDSTVHTEAKGTGTLSFALASP
jgi:hypothetical protein